ncbi:hypothetical protein E1176_02535 [Fulvivirga sp. RKSG066]|uniref:hypothetical protein n=1 Tax=Fulvivirga aurantia TaxID=2529383 RepID=UPI0012BD7597|nr:hypothetical protein [Fulvivirga aurantia]MTI19889.1 hypothetical protein [Fulvivirga aurantia]
MSFKSCKRYIIGFLILFTFAANQSQAQEVGLSFSYFVPKDGYVSTPVSPFSIRGVGVDLNQYMAIQTGFSLYRMSGLNIKDIDDFESKEPLLGPNFTIMVPLEFVIQFIGKRQEFRLKGGGFSFYGFSNKLNYGNIDDAIKKAEGWDVANADFDYNHGIGLGYYFGTEYVIRVTNQWGLSLEANYFIGDADIELNGSYTGGNMTGPLETKAVDYPDSKVDYTGLEISVGILFGS